MKHVEAGLIVGLIVAGALVIGAALWAVLNLLAGPYAASIGLGVVAVVAVTSMLIDWKTEKKETP